MELLHTWNRDVSQQLCCEGLLSLHKRLTSAIDGKYDNYLMTFISV